MAFMPTGMPVWPVTAPVCMPVKHIQRKDTEAGIHPCLKGLQLCKRQPQACCRKY